MKQSLLQNRSRRNVQLPQNVHFQGKKEQLLHAKKEERAWKLKRCQKRERERERERERRKGGKEGPLILRNSSTTTHPIIITGPPGKGPHGARVDSVVIKIFSELRTSPLSKRRTLCRCQRCLFCSDVDGECSIFLWDFPHPFLTSDFRCFPLKNEPY